MSDPQPAPADSAEADAAAPHSAMLPELLAADYQFSSRRERRDAELTGMIPIIIPGVSAAAAPAEVPLPSDEADAGTPVHVTAPDTGLTPVVVDAAAASSTTTSSTADIEERFDDAFADEDQAALPQPVSAQWAAGAPAAAAAAAPVPAAPVVSDEDVEDLDVLDASTPRGPNTSTGEIGTAPHGPAPAGPAPVSAMDVAGPAPVSAMDVAGIVPVPVPLAAGPLEARPAAVAALKAPRTPKAGRDLPAAISVAVVLLALILGSLFLFPLALVVLASIFVCVGVWEVTRALAGKGINAPLTPVMVGALAMPASAYFGGSEGLLFALVASCGATLLWRSLDPEPGALKSIMAGVFSLLWIPFLLSFVFLMLRGEQGPTLGLTLDLSQINPGVMQIVIMLGLVVASDTFGYLVGVLFGRHPMAPKISPKKSWEGFAGSVGGALLLGIPATVFLLSDHWWVGVVLAIGMVVAGTGGDFAESMVKRELGVKDMSNLLPGHGGVMDRLDSILFASPVAYATFTLLGQF